MTMMIVMTTASVKHLLFPRQSSLHVVTYFILTQTPKMQFIN